MPVPVRETANLEKTLGDEASLYLNVTERLFIDEVFRREALKVKAG